MSNKKKTQKQTMLDGMMTFGKLDDGLNALDFSSFEAVEMEPFTATCKVQAMRDGNVYITEKPKRVRNKPLFREDNSSLTLGRDGNYYFVFKLSEELVKELPDRLVQQSLAIAQKIERRGTPAGNKGRTAAVRRTAGGDKERTAAGENDMNNVNVSHE